MANESQNLTNPNDVVDINLLNYFEGKIGNKYASQAGLAEVAANKADKSTTYTKAEVDNMIDQLENRYQVTVTGHTCVFGNNAIVTGHKLVLT